MRIKDIARSIGLLMIAALLCLACIAANGGI